MRDQLNPPMSAILPRATAPNNDPTPPNVLYRPIVIPSNPGGAISAKKVKDGGPARPSPSPNNTPDSRSRLKESPFIKVSIPIETKITAGKMVDFLPNRSDSKPAAIVVKNCGKCVILMNAPICPDLNPFASANNGMILNRPPCLLATIMSENRPTKVNAGFKSKFLRLPLPRFGVGKFDWDCV